MFADIADVRFSGSTCCTVITYGRKLYIANVGDSRAIMIKSSNATQSCVALSRDHKPGDASEEKVILAKGGRIDAYRDQQGNSLGPLRVWL